MCMKICVSAYVCVSFACSLVFFLFDFPSLSFFVYNFYYYYLGAYLYSNEREKERVCASMDGEVVSGKSLGEEKF